MTSSRRSDLVERIGVQLGRELSTRTIVFHQTVADCLGIAATDHKCLGFIAEADHPVTAGELATITGLTPVTAYSIQVRSFADATGFSDWSDPVIRIVT